MSDTLGFRMKIAVLVPSTNTTLQTEYDAMRAPGITHHVRSIPTPSSAPRTDAQFIKRLENMRTSMVDAMDEVLTIKPTHVILDAVPEAAGGVAAASLLRDRLLAKTSKRASVSIGFDAIIDAVRRYHGIKRIGVVTPYVTKVDERVQRFFQDCGFGVVCVKGLGCKSPAQVAQTSEATLRDAIVEAGGQYVDAVVIVGSNLPMSRIAGEAEFWLGKPVIAQNTATYWHAMRWNGIHTQIDGFGKLLSEF